MSLQASVAERPVVLPPAKEGRAGCRDLTFLIHLSLRIVHYVPTADGPCGLLASNRISPTTISTPSTFRIAIISKLKSSNVNRPPHHLAASFISNQACDLGDWHIASIWTRALNGRYRRKADIVRHWRRMHRSLLTHQRHWLCTAAMVLMPVSTPIKVLV